MKIYFLTVPQEQALKAALDAEGLYIEDEDGERSYYGNVRVTQQFNSSEFNEFGFETVTTWTESGLVTLDWIGQYQKLTGYDQDGEPNFTPVIGFHINLYAPDWWELPAQLTGYTKRPATPYRLPAGFAYAPPEE